MKIFRFFFLAGVGLVGLAAHALNDDAQEIFDKSRRQLDPPPKSLKANSEAWDSRYATGVARTQRLAANKPSAADEAMDKELDQEGAYLPGAAKHHHKAEAPEWDGERVFGVGFVMGGAYGVFGTEADFGLNKEWSAGFGFGTGMTYSTWGVHSRFYFREAKLSPFAQVGYANWYLRRVSSSPDDRPTPSFMAEKFFENSQGALVPGKHLNLLYPGLGIMYQSPSGLAASAQLQYYINMDGFDGALYGALGFYYYF